MAEKNIEVLYGITRIVMAPTVRQVPMAKVKDQDFYKPTMPEWDGADAITFIHIVNDSVSMTQTATTYTNISFEETGLKTVYRLPTEEGTEEIVFSVASSNEAVLARLGYVRDTDGMLYKIPGFELPDQSILIETKELGASGAGTVIAIRNSVSVTPTGSLGKGGLQNWQFTLTQTANFVTEAGDVKMIANSIIKPGKYEPELP